MSPIFFSFSLSARPTKNFKSLKVQIHLSSSTSAPSHLESVSLRAAVFLLFNEALMTLQRAAVGPTAESLCDIKKLQIKLKAVCLNMRLELML